MVTEVYTAAATWLRRYLIDGDASSGANNPKKADGLATFAALDARLASSLVVDAAMSLTAEQQAQGRANLGLTESVGLNIFLNPTFTICQDRAVAATVSISADGYLCDGVGVLATGGGVLTGAVVAKATAASPYRARLIVATADTSLSSTDRYAWSLPIEGIDAAGLLWGTSAAKSLALSVVVNMPAGTYAISVQNSGGTRSYVHVFIVSSAEAGSDKSVTVIIPGDTTGTWTMAAGSSGLVVRLCLAAGSAYQTTTLDAWQSGAYLSGTAQTNGLAASSAVFELGDLGAWVGSVVGMVSAPNYGDELRLCMRYYHKFGAGLIGRWITATNAYFAVPVTPPMAGTAAVSIVSGAWNCSRLGTASQTGTGCSLLSGSSLGATGGEIGISFTGAAATSGEVASLNTDIIVASARLAL